MSNLKPMETPVPLSENEYIAIRKNKLQSLVSSGVTIYPDRFPGFSDIRLIAEKEPGGESVRTAGRLVSMRRMGKLVFAHIQDITGKIQVAIRPDAIGAEAFSVFKDSVDIGDFIGVEGTLFLTRTGELTIDVRQYEFLSKCLRPLPEKWHGLTDIEAIFRQRYLDLIMSEHSRKKFLAKSRMIQSIRKSLLENGFIEVETPVLQSKPSGALAKPFKTYHEALNQEVYLRIAPETYLKRLIVGGFTRIFEFARCFRNEGISQDHLQDFTMLEYYVAYWNFEDNMQFTERLVQKMLEDLTGSHRIQVGEDILDFSGSWPRVSFRNLLLKDTGVDIDQIESAAELMAEIKSRRIDLEINQDELHKLGKGSLIDLLYKRVSRPRLVQPVFLMGHPVETSPLARRNDHHPGIVDRFQLVAGGVELINAYSELADPVDQRQRFEAQAALKAAGDPEAMDVDEDFLMALEYGMPPTSGWGMGIDRFVKFLFNEDNIKNCVLFPLMKPEK